MLGGLAPPRPAAREGMKGMTVTLEGGCLCGARRYRIEADGAVASICHCATCRRAAGAPSVAWATVARSAFAWTRGAPAAHVSSPGVVRTHCPACGTSLTYQSATDSTADSGAGSIDVTVASLDDPEALPPASETWLSHRLSWEPIDPARPGFPRGGPGEDRT